ncbi:MAG: TolC family protein [Planctomycetota bacterium]
MSAHHHIRQSPSGRLLSLATVVLSLVGCRAAPLGPTATAYQESAARGWIARPASDRESEVAAQAAKMASGRPPAKPTHAKVSPVHFALHSESPNSEDADQRGASSAGRSLDPTILPVALQEPSANYEELPAPRADQPVLSRPPQALDPDLDTAPREPLSLLEVNQAVFASFPALEAALREAEIAEGKQTSAWGEFDLKMKAESMSAPEGFYKTYRNLVKLEQGLWQGSNVYSQYRLGSGNFPVYYGERETNDGGEFKVGMIAPLLRDRSIDERRAKILQTTLQRQQVDPFVQERILEYTLIAADAYWSWVAAGLALEAQRELLRVTVERNGVYEKRVKSEDLAPIELVQNERLIASREAKLLETERKLQQYAIKLSLFFRDAAGNPQMPSRALLPSRFPRPEEPERERLEFDVQDALAARPELRELAFQVEQVQVDLAAGQNQRLPSLNAVVEASKDVGGPIDKKNSMGPFALEAGLLFDVPLQRRKADGQIISAQGKLAQLSAKRRYTENKIATEVQDAVSGMITAYERVARAQRNTVLALRLEEAERKRFEAEDSDLLRVAIQESAAIEAQLLEIDALADFHKARAAYRAALALDPLAEPAVAAP